MDTNDTKLKEDMKACAMEIVNQLGGPLFVRMTGVNCMVYDHKAPTPNVSFKFKGSRKANHVNIVLDVMDTYTVTFYNIRGVSFKMVEEHTGIYNDMLRSIFENTTGLATSLGTLGR